MRPLILALIALTATPAFADPPGHDQLPGQHFNITADSLPAPPANNQPYLDNAPQRIERGDAVPIAPPGFTLTLYASGLPHPRRIDVMADSTVLVMQQATGQLVGFRDTNEDGIADAGGVLLASMTEPFGLVVEPDGNILVSDPTEIFRVLTTEQRSMVITAPGSFGAAAGHVTRPMAVEPGTGNILVSVGSMANLEEGEVPVKATIQRMAPDGTNMTTFATGLRNATGLRFRPGTSDLYAVVMERDGMGDELVPDYFTRVEQGDDFGWPYQYAGGIVQPEFSDGSHKRPASKLPDVMFEAHSAPMDLVFLPDSWPEGYRGNAVVALKGSANRAEPTGYKLVIVPFGADGRPSGGYDNFMTGFWLTGTTPAQVWGRPAALAIMPDGGLLVGDDFGGTVWKVMPPKAE